MGWRTQYLAYTVATLPKGGLAVGPAVVDTDVVVLGAVGIAIFVLDEWAAAGIWLGARLLALLVADGAGVVGSLLVVMVFAASWRWRLWVSRGGC